MEITPIILRAHTGDTGLLALAHLAEEIRTAPETQPIQIDLSSYEGLLTPSQIAKAALANQHRITFKNPSRAA